MEAEELQGRRQHPLGGGEVLQRADDVHVGLRDHERPTESAVHHAGGLGVTEGEVGAQRPLEQLDHAVVAAAGPEPQPGDLHVGPGLLGRGGGPAQQGEPGLGQAHGRLEAEAGRREVRGAVHEARRLGRVGGGPGLQGVAGSGDHVGVGGMGAQDGAIARWCSRCRRGTGISAYTASRISSCGNA